MNHPALSVLRVAFTGFTLIAWSLASRALWAAAPGETTLGVIVVATSLAFGLFLDLAAVAGIGGGRGDVRRACASIGALVGSSMAFPPTSVPTSSAAASLFAFSAALMAIGAAYDVFAAASDDRPRA